MLIRDDSRCYRCGREGATEVDHVVSIARGGTHELSNLRAVCSVCHARKSRQEYYQDR
ncbi:HNH endonuclease [Nonomuraea gerenzanensis]|uniref:HNH endonuclease n=1 Tax=Nonomuraea gerenzanensis TaxID=93944 RepID=UPI001CD9DA43|nr:HNH endonuclease [Nonomuraea gerenzanensis]